MLEIYSTNVSVLEGADIPLNQVKALKGNTSVPQGASSIVLNKCGVYKIEVTANVTPDEAGTVSIQLKKDGALVENAIAQATAAVDTIYNLNFVTYVQVSINNNPECPCLIPTVISVVNGDAATFSLINVVVDKIV